MKSKIEKSFFIIKPEVFLLRQEIRETIEKDSGLRIEDFAVMNLTDEDIDFIYLDDIGSPLMTAIKSQLIGQPVEAGIVSGENAIDRLIDVCGDKPIPADCQAATIRKKYGLIKPVRLDGLDYYLNAIHKASRQEAAASVDWFLNHKKRDKQGTYLRVNSPKSV